MLPRKNIMNNLRHWFNCSNPWYLLCWHQRGIFSIKTSTELLVSISLLLNIWKCFPIFFTSDGSRGRLQCSFNYLTYFHHNSLFLKIISSLLDATLHFWHCKILQQHPCSPATQSALFCPVLFARKMHRSKKAKIQLTLYAAGSFQSYTIAYSYIPSPQCQFPGTSLATAQGNEQEQLDPTLEMVLLQQGLGLGDFQGSRSWTDRRRRNTVKA